jgi:hypothetical protein
MGGQPPYTGVVGSFPSPTVGVLGSMACVSYRRPPLTKLTIETLPRRNWVASPVPTKLNWGFGWVAQTSLKINCWFLHLVWCCYGLLVACVVYDELGMVFYASDCHLCFLAQVFDAMLNSQLC